LLGLETFIEEMISGHKRLVGKFGGDRILESCRLKRG
jgi:hypothetical protein